MKVLNVNSLGKSRNSCAESAEWVEWEGRDNCKETEDIKYSANCAFALSRILVVVLVIVAFESTHY